MDLTVLIITKNAEGTVEKTLKSVAGWAGNSIIIDDYSIDKTKQIARNYGCTVILHLAHNFRKQRAFALSQVITKWTLVLDSDEVLTPANKKEIDTAILNEKYDGYYLTFRNHLFGKKLKHGELHKKLVLFKTKKATISSQEIHEQYEVKGILGHLPSEILHYSYQSFGQVIRKFFSYSILQARQYKREKKNYGFRELILNPIHMFYERFVKDEGYKDGVQRLFLDYEFAHMEFLSYFFILFVKEKKRISVDCGSYSVGGTVQSGIDRLLQGIYSHISKEYDYFWFSFTKTSPNSLPTRFFSQLWLPLYTILNRCDIFLGAAGNIPALLSYFPIKKILFLHDFGFFSSPDKYDSSAKRLQTQTEGSIRRADSIVFFHEEIYKEFIKRYPHYSYKAVVIPAGADHLVKIKEEPLFIQQKKPLLLFVGVVKPVKRIDKIISAVGETYCIIAGPQEKEYIKSLKIGKTQNIQFIQNFSDGQLKWLYKKADVLVYTSEHEGFCYPVLEALTLGLPVIALNLPLFQEYKKSFPHLTLVESVEEMKKQLVELKEKPKIVLRNNPYSWEAFNSSLYALANPCLPAGRSEVCKRPADPNSGKIAFIVVLYKTPQEEKSRLEQEIIQMGVASYAIYWIDNSINGKGYATGINEGICRGLIEGCDLFIALNPDISLTPITAKKIEEIAREFDVWGFAMEQNNTIYYGGEIDKWRLSGGLIKKKPAVRFSSVDFISGSIMGFSKNVLQTIGLLDESYFMYYEDVDYCERARQAGLSVGIDSNTVYKHFEVSQVNEKKAKWIKKSRWKFFWKYANWKQKIRELVRLPKTLADL